MSKHGVYWPIPDINDIRTSLKGRTCLVEEMSSEFNNFYRVKFEEWDYWLLFVQKSDIYFQDHPKGYNQLDYKESEEKI